MKYAAEFVNSVGTDDLYEANPCWQIAVNGDRPVGPILDVADPTNLNKIIARWREEYGGVSFFRGQRRLYHQLPLSGAFRNYPHEPLVPNILSSFLQVCYESKDCWSKLDQMLFSDSSVMDFRNGFADVPEYALEGLFQHYEGGTRWLDVVDNLQVALWMATRRYSNVGDAPGGPVQIVSEAREDDGGESVYLYLISLRELESQFSGLSATPDGTRLLDLRKALPARFLRPHAQHSALLRTGVPTSTEDGFDLGADDDAKCAILKIPLETAKDCCGGSLLSVETLFPDLNVDGGFEQISNLLKSRLLQAPKHLRISEEKFPPRYIDARSTEAKSLLRKRGDLEVLLRGDRQNSSSPIYRERSIGYRAFQSHT